VIPLVPTTGSVARPPGASTERAGTIPSYWNRPSCSGTGPPR